jgi:L-fuconolactonase
MSDLVSNCSVPNAALSRVNFPVDKMGTGYPTLWNAFKLITAGCSQAEKLALYSGTAKRLYHLD